MGKQHPPDQTGARGSQKLLEKLSVHGHVPSLDEIKKALNLAPGVELKVPNWLIRGIPPVWLHGVRRDVSGAAATTLCNARA